MRQIRQALGEVACGEAGEVASFKVCARIDTVKENKHVLRDSDVTWSGGKFKNAVAIRPLGYYDES